MGLNSRGSSEDGDGHILERLGPARATRGLACVVGARLRHCDYDFEEENVEKAQLGVRVAASRKLEHELGVPPSQTPVDEFQYLTRIHHLAPSDGTSGEHEGSRARTGGK